MAEKLWRGFISVMKIFLWLSAALILSTPILAEKSNVRATFLGLAYGDAFGAITESWTREQVAAIFPQLSGIPTEAPLAAIYKTFGEAQIARTRLYGYTTDDTQQAGLLAIIAISHSKWNESAIENWAEAVRVGSEIGAWRGHGKQFTAATEKILKYIWHRQTGSFSAGIGASMRTGVLGAIYRDDLESLRRATIESTLATHADVRAVAIAYAVAWANYAFLNHLSVEAIRAKIGGEVWFIESRALDYAKNGWNVNTENPHLISDALKSIFLKSPRSAEEISKEIVHHAARVMKKFATELHPNDPFALLGGVHAIALALMESADPRTILRYVVRLGSDSDTVAAMLGSIFGARFGEGWIPVQELAEYKRFSVLAQRMVDRNRDRLESPKDFLMKEKAVRVSEITFQSRCLASIAHLK
jgi:ADP-ribosyl-[dinitrogen reductase] hydrolase